MLARLAARAAAAHLGDMKSPPPSSVPVVFDRARVQRHRMRSATSRIDFLRDRTAAELLDRLSAVKRRFTRVLELGGGAAFARARGTSPETHDQIAAPIASTDLAAGLLAGAPGPAAVVDEERLPFAEAAFDLIVSPLALHATNDLPGALLQIRRALAPDGLFLGALFGGRTLVEWRSALAFAEAEITGGARARIAPTADARDLASLLQRAGLALPVTDVETFTVRYAHPLAILSDVAGMGERSALVGTTPLRRDVLTRAVEAYARDHADPDGRVRATFEVIHAAAWAPHDSQQQPLKPGSAKARLADAVGAVELSAGERAAP